METTFSCVDPINVDSLWIIGPRAKGGKRDNAYHGNFAPQIPNDLIRRFTEEGDIVLDMFMGSGTTLFECETLHRRFIGFDINKPLVESVWSQMESATQNDFCVHICDICDGANVNALIKNDLFLLQRDSIDIVFSHPPYVDIIRFTEEESDLSHISDISLFKFRMCSTS